MTQTSIQALQPLHDRVLIQPIPVESISKGGIHIPDSAKEKPQRGKVMFCGNFYIINDLLEKLLNHIKNEDSEYVSRIKQYKDNLIQLEVKVGDTVLYGKFAGHEIEIDGEKYLLMRESDIMAIYL